MLDRKRALELLEKHIENISLRRHCLATEAIMRSLAEKLEEDSDVWGLTGLLHDLDFEKTSDEPSRHGKVTAEILKSEGVPECIYSAIMEHNAEELGIERTTKMGIALAASESITGLVVATALVMPSKKLADVKPSSVVKRMKKKDFARNVNREIIRECESLGIPLDKFAENSVDAMSRISSDLGL